MTKVKGNNIVKLDGFCNLCSYWAKFIIKHDSNKIFTFENNETNSIIYSKNNVNYYKSEAIIEIISDLNKFPTVVTILKLTPTFFLDLFYSAISKRRYFLFGKRNTCYLP